MVKTSSTATRRTKTASAGASAKAEAPARASAVPATMSADAPLRQPQLAASAAALQEEEALFGLRSRPAPRAQPATTTTTASAAPTTPAAAPPAAPSGARRPQRGVVYFSSVPANMRPNEVRAEFERFGEIFRQKFVPFGRNDKSSEAAAALIAGGATTKKSTNASSKKAQKEAERNVQFKEGWLEYLYADDARNAVDQMNAHPVFVRRGRRAHGCTWMCRFLEGFQWSDLLAELEGERRSARLEAYEERMRERKLNEQFRSLVRSHHDARRAARKGDDDDEEGDGHEKARRAGRGGGGAGAGKRVKQGTAHRPAALPNLWDGDAAE